MTSQTDSSTSVELSINTQRDLITLFLKDNTKVDILASGSFAKGSKIGLVSDKEHLVVLNEDLTGPVVISAEMVTECIESGETDVVGHILSHQPE